MGEAKRHASGGSEHCRLCVATRRDAVGAISAAGIGFLLSGASPSRGEPADERPKEGDLLTSADGTGPLTAEAIVLGARPTLAWPIDASTGTVRDGSRLNKLVVVRLDPSSLDDVTRTRAADGIVAYSAICVHAGCPVTAWVKSDVGDKEVFKCMCHNSEYDPRQGAEVVFGPAPRRLPALPVAIADGSLTIAAGFIGKVGAQQPG